jgi:hypothetical protein
MCEIPQQNPLEQSIYTLKNEDQEGKTGPVSGWVPVDKGRVSGEGEGGQIWSMYFVYLHENRTVKSVKLS